MSNFLKNSIPFFILLFLLPKFNSAQCVTTTINAQAGTGPSTTICSGQCANLTATISPPPNSTTTYSVASVTYSTLPYFGGNNVFSTSSDDLWSDSISIGFNFCYFGQTYNKLLVGSNGEITFDLSMANGPEQWITTAVLPNLIEHPGNTICGAYRDYDPLPGGVVRTYTTGVAPCRQFVAYWSGVTLFSCSTPVSSFQIILYEGTNQIAVNIQNSTACPTWNNGRGLIGIQNSGATVAYGPATRNTLTSWTAINESWRFIPTAAPSYSVNWAGPGGFTATGLTATPCPTSSGNYSATISYCGGSKTSTVQVNVSTPTINVSASSTTVCPPGSVTLTATGATTYTWLPGSLTGSSVVVSPAVNTTYTVLGTSGTCTNSATIPITVGTAPTVNAFNLSGTICPGNSANAVATGALTYTWNPGSITGNIVALSPTVTTTYTILGSSGGCPGTTTLTIPVGNTPTITASSSPTSICAGNSATLSATGATSYTWNPGAATGSSVVVTPTATTVYTVTGTTTLVCPGTKTVMLTVNTTPTLTAVSNPATICAGSTATLTSTGATTYTWNPGSLSGGTVTVSPASTTVYTVTGSNGTCSSTKTVQTTVNPVPTVTASISSPTICAGTSVTLTAGGATTYTWNPGNLSGASVVTTPTSNTTYTVIGSNGTCTNSAQVSVTVNPTPTLTAVANPTAICSGAGTTVTLTSSGATSYTWMPGSLSGATVTTTPASTTTYTVSGTNASGCVSTKTVLLTVNTTPTVTASASSATICAGNSVTLTSSGATTYTWMPGSLTGGTISVTPTITTTYTVTGANGSCTGTKTVNVTVNPNPTVAAVANPTLICSGSSATLTGSGATSYTWMPGSITTSSTVVNPATTTIYTLTGSNGSCTNSVAVTVSVNPTPVVTATANPSPLCRGTSATLTASGATSYTWMPGSLTGTSVVVSPTVNTTYTVTGANGVCTNSTTVFLIVVPAPTVNATANPTLICTGSSATLTGTGALSYTWMPGSLSGSSVVVNPTVTTTYTVSGTNGLGCISTSTLVLTVNPNPTLTAVASPTAICVGSTATLTSTGATSYTWNPGALTGGTVTVSPTVTTIYTVTGANGTCSNTKTVSLTVNPTPTVTAAVSSPSICSGSSATLTSSGATTYTWMPGSLSGGTVTVSPTVTTTYTVTGANAAGCTNTKTVTLNVTPGPTLVATASPTTICSGSSSTLSASGATTYTWMPGSITTATTVVTPTTTTNYTLTGNNGTCSSTIAVTVSVTPLPTVTAVSNPTSVCAGQSSTLTASGASTYTWMPGSLSGATVVVTPTASLVYTVTGANGLCTATAITTLIVNPSPTVTAAVNPTTQIICSGRTTTLSAGGALTYTWMPGSMVSPNVVVGPTVTTTYTLTGANASGCTNSIAITITVNPSPTITVTGAPSLSICSGQSATLTASGAVGTYSWLPGPIFTNPIVVTPLSTTGYTVFGASGGCRSNLQFSVTVTPNPTVTAAASAATLCSGSTVTLSSTGATTYTWMPGSLSGGTVTATPTVTTTYTVTGANGNCTNSNTVLVTVTPGPTVTAAGSPTALCSGNSATLTAGGATSYTWMPGSLLGGTITVTPTVTTTYTVTGTNGTCSNTATVSLTVTATPTLTAASNPTGICVGSSATLTSTGATSYTWMPGSLSGGTVTVSPTVTTVYTVSGANGSCTNTQTVSLTVSPIPTVSAVANPTAVCAGSSATLSGTGATTYTWMPGSLTGASVVVNPTITTTYTVTGSNGTCTNTNTVTLTIFSAPTVGAATSKTVICLGDTATLSATGAVSYTWNPGALIGTPQLVSPTVTTVYTVTGSNGICSSNSTVSIVVNTYPVISTTLTPATLCAGGTATIIAAGAATYTWMPGSLSGSSVAVSPTVSTTYTITGANGNCASTTTVALTVNPNPTITASSSPATPVCAGNSYTLSATGATTYTWMPGSLSGGTVVVTPTANTVYTVTGANASGCSTTRTVNLIVIPGPTLTAAANPTTICSGQTATLTATGALTYTWMPVAVTGSSITVSPTVTTTYTVTGVNLAGCSATKTVALIVNTTPTITASTSSATLCSGNSATLTSSGATTYTWNPGAITGGTVVVTPTTNTTYTVIGANGTCTDTKTVGITVNPTPTVTASASPTILCNGGTSTLTAGGALTYTWMPGSLSGSTVVISPTVITTYTVSGVNSFGCVGTNTVLVNVNTPTITTSASSNTICIGGSATITAAGASSYTWMPGGNTTSGIIVSPTITTTYTVTGLSPFGCLGTQTVLLNVVPVPTIIAVSSSTAICSGNSATLTGSGASTYTWMPGSLTGSNVVVSPTATTVYTITGSNGSCTNSNTISLTVNPNPTVTGVASPSIMCSGATSTLSALGATTYTWYPGGIPALMLAVTPSITTVYTVTGTDALGCSGSGTVQVTINDPTVTATSTPTSICIGSSATLTASGASTYTWNPGATSGSSVSVTPTVTTTYSVIGTNTMGCQGKTTLLLTVFVNPTVTAAASPTTLCSGLSATLTSAGAMSYTWIPGSMTGSMVVTSPTTTTTYSVIGVNGVCAADTATITINVLPSPQNVTATNNGTITCLTPSVDLFGSSTTTNVVYQWAGPGSYTSSTQNPTGLTTGGVYTLSVIDLTNGCTTTATTAIFTNTAGPAVSLTSTGTINCITNTVSISVSSTVAAVTYTWSGPASFTSTASSFTTTIGGVYTVSAFDPASGCTSTNTVAATTDTYVAITATITPATCTGTVSNNDGTIKVTGFVNPNDKYDMVSGSTYTGSATYATATVIPVSGTITNTLANPLVNTSYTIRFFGANGCTKDTTLILVPVDCSVNNALGIAKAISAVTTNTNGTYSVTYKVVVKNTGFATLNNVTLTENLSNTFPLPTTFTVSSAPVIITPVTSLTLDPTFNGSSQPVITNTVSSSLLVNEVDTIVFTVDVLPNGVFGTFKNSVLGTAVGGASSTLVSDSSQVGLNTDPDNDGNPTNNNTPTPLNLTPKTFFGVTKTGELSQALSDGSYDITYTVSIHNLGNDTLRNIVLKDSLAGTTIKSPASYTMKNGPYMLSGTLTPNSAYNGNSDPNLIVTTGSKMAPNTVNSVVFTINVMPDTVTVISNSATGSAIGTSTTPVTDISNDGNNPDVNGNGVWNEPSDNIPTVLIIDKFFVPEVFTPNGDGVNDFFVIKGIQKTENTLTIYNRWGNKVYKADNYDNTWNGMPNVNGTLGNQKLPQGTYYYILEFKGETNLKTVNGFVVLQY